LVLLLLRDQFECPPGQLRRMLLAVQLLPEQLKLDQLRLLFPEGQLRQMLLEGRWRREAQLRLWDL
jgi:hypothetical protein